MAPASLVVKGQVSLHRASPASSEATLAVALLGALFLVLSWSGSRRGHSAGPLARRLASWFIRS